MASDPGPTRHPSTGRSPTRSGAPTSSCEAISEERVLGAVNTIAGQPIDFGPMSAGPGGIAKVRAYGAIGRAIATRLRGDRIAYRVLLPVDLTFELDLQVEKQQFDAELLVPLTLTAVARSGLRIFIEATPPAGSEVQVELKAKGLRASRGAARRQRGGRAASVRGALRRPRAGQAARPRGAHHRRVPCDRPGLGLASHRDHVPTRESPPT